MSDPDNSQKPAANNTGRNLWLVAVVAAASALGAVGGQHLTKLGLDAWRGQGLQQRIAAAEWKHHLVGELSLEVPFELNSADGVLNHVPTSVKDMISSMEIHSTGKSQADFMVMVLHTKYKPGVAVSLDGAAAGGIGNVAKEAGDADPKYTLSGREISGLEARRGSYQGHPRGNSVRIESIAIQRTQDIWSVMVLFQSEAGKPLADRVLESVRIGGQ